MLIKTGAFRGAIIGAGIAVIMISLDFIRPFSPNVNAFIERLAFRICPFYVLGLTNFVTNKASWFLATILGNAFLYGLVGAGLAAVANLFKRFSV